MKYKLIEPDVVSVLSSVCFFFFCLHAVSDHHSFSICKNSMMVCMFSIEFSFLFLKLKRDGSSSSRNCLTNRNWNARRMEWNNK